MKLSIGHWRHRLKSGLTPGDGGAAGAAAAATCAVGEQATAKSQGNRQQLRLSLRFAGLAFHTHCRVTGRGLKARFNISISLRNSCRGAVTLQISSGDAA
eukprot:4322213-Pleurochrysis_carterae.AAC.5